MGIIIAKFRKKKTTYELLEKLDTEIKAIEEFRRSTEQTQKKMVGRFIFISICVYCVTALIFYFYFFPASVYERIIYIIPLIILPVLLIFIKKILSWYYNRKIRKNQKKLSILREEKKKILEDVKEKETYKVAKTILEKFAPEQVRNNTLGNESTPSRPSGPMLSSAPSQSALRYRGPGQPPMPFNRMLLGPTGTPTVRQPFVPGSTPLLPKGPLLSQSLLPSAGPVAISGTPLMMPRGILPRDRTVLDKMVDYLVGDGPSNRYALICKSCSSHNGMALKEEFDYLSFKCCYCGYFNPARKKRPIAPKLESSLMMIQGKRSDVSDSDANSRSESDSEDEGPIITEPPSDSPDGDKVSEHEKVSESEKLSDVDGKSTDNESLPMDIDDSLGNTEPVVEQETGICNVESTTTENISETITTKD